MMKTEYWKRYFNVKKYYAVFYDSRNGSKCYGETIETSAFNFLEAIETIGRKYHLNWWIYTIRFYDENGILKAVF